MDDSNYLTVGFEGKGLEGKALGSKDERGEPNPTRELYPNVTFKDQTFYPNSYAAVKAGLIDLYAWYYDMTATPTLKGGSVVEGTPYMITPDNVKVWQITRTSTVNSTSTQVTSKDSSAVARTLANAMESPKNLLHEMNGYKIDILDENSNNSQSGNSGSSSSGGSSSSSSGGSSSSSSGGGSSSSSGGGSQGTAANGNETDDSNDHNVDQYNSEPAVTGNNSDENSQNADPDASLNQEKQSGNGQNNAGTWKQEESHGSRWWIYLLGIGACAGAWFLIWKRREEDSDS